MSKENQIDLINPNKDHTLGHGSMIAGYDSMEQLLSFVEASLNGGGNATLIVAMTMATCKNLIDEKLSDEEDLGWYIRRGKTTAHKLTVLSDEPEEDGEDGEKGKI